MKIAIIGYGKMGKAIEEIALEKGHETLLKIGSANTEELTVSNLQQCDVAIEFSGPENAAKNILFCINSGMPVVSGSTGWHDLDEVENYCIKHKGAFIHASNFSIGVNVFFAVNEHLAGLLASRTEYEIKIDETHHTQKKDAPSGTAITLAEGVINKLSRKTSWTNHEPATEDAILITSKRIDPVPGTHRVTYFSEVDEIEITHTAHNRKGFAEGTVLAAEFILGKKGIFSMKEVLGI